MRQSSLANIKKPHPYNTKMPPLSWGKVVARNSDNTVDVAMQNGSTFQHVQIAANILGSQLGSAYIPTNDLTNPTTTPDGVWDVPTASTKGDLFCIVGFLDGSSRQPKILGFFNPQQSEMTLSTLGAKLERHESGVYNITLPNGHDERHFPDGSYIVFGDTTSHDMTSENTNWNPPTQLTPIPMVIKHSTGTTIEIDTTGKVIITPVNGVEIGGTEALALSAPLSAWLNNHTHTSATAGSPTSAPTSPVSGISSTTLTTS